MTKVCKKCGIEKADSEFCKHAARPDGLRMYCRSCMSEKKKLYHQKYGGKYGGYNKERYLKIKDNESFKLAANKRAKKSYEINKKTVNARAIEWAKNNKDRARIIAHKYRKKQSDELHDSYVKSLLKDNGFNYNAESVEVYREIVKIKRALKNK